MGEAFDRTVREAAGRYGEELHAVSTGFVSGGPDFGSDAVAVVEPPRVALLTGSGTSSGSAGEVWHFFEKQLRYPVHLINTDDFGGAELSNYDVLVLPSGYYGQALSDGRLAEVREWISGGGRLVALAGANGFLAGREGFALQSKSPDASAGEQEPEEPMDLGTYIRRQRQNIPSSNAGSIFRVTLDNTHPLGYGYGEHYFSLKLDADAYAPLERGWNVGVTPEGSHMSGFVGHRAGQRIANTLTFGVQGMGGGSVVYMVDNPLFRAFWQNGKLLFANAVFMVD